MAIEKLRKMLSGAAQRWRANYLGMFFVGTHRGVQELGEGENVRGCLAQGMLFAAGAGPDGRPAGAPAAKSMPKTSTC